MEKVSEIALVPVKTTLPVVPYPPAATRPAVRTERLLLRPMTLADAEGVHAIRAQPEVMQWTVRGTPDSDLAQTREYIAGKLPPHDAANYDFAICLAATGAIIGVGGVHRRQGGLGWPVMGYLFRREAWGKGYATEFVRALLPLWWALPRAEEELRVDADTVVGEGEAAREVLVALTAADNGPSKKVLTKSGLELVKVWEEPDERNKEVMIELHGFAAKRRGDAAV